jgi:membrane associated rhomboid family serine protease
MIGKPERMFPIRDHNPSGRVPHVTRFLIVANVLIFLAYWYGLPDEASLTRFIYTYGLIPAALTQRGEWAGLVTSMFLHGGWAHLLGNMMFLHVFGDNLEDSFGHFGFLAFYLASGIGAGMAQVVADPVSLIPMVGASGAIAGVMGGYLLLFPRARVDVLIIIVIFFRIFTIPAFIVLAFWFGLQLISGVSTPTDAGGVAYWAHAGGFIAGIALALLPWLRRGGPAFWQRSHGVPAHPAVQTRIPRVGRAPRR